MNLNIPWGENVTTLDLDEFFPCKAQKWDVLVQIFKRAPNEVEIYEKLIPYMYNRIGRLYVERDEVEAQMETGNLRKSRATISHCNAQIKWFTRRVKLLERLLQTA